MRLLGLIIITAFLLILPAWAEGMPFPPAFPGDSLSAFVKEYGELVDSNREGVFYSSCILKLDDPTQISTFEEFFVIPRARFKPIYSENAYLFEVAKDEGKYIVPDVGLLIVHNHLVGVDTAIQGGMGVQEEMRRVTQPLLRKPMKLSFSFAAIFEDHPHQACELSPDDYDRPEPVRYTPNVVALRGYVTPEIYVADRPEREVRVLTLEPSVPLMGDADPSSPNRDSYDYLNELEIVSLPEKYNAMMGRVMAQGVPVIVRGKLRQGLGPPEHTDVVIDALSVERAK